MPRQVGVITTLAVIPRTIDDAVAAQGDKDTTQLGLAEDYYDMCSVTNFGYAQLNDLIQRNNTYKKENGSAMSIAITQDGPVDNYLQQMRMNKLFRIFYK